MHRLLITGKTVPNYVQKYVENVNVSRWGIIEFINRFYQNVLRLMNKILKTSK